MSKFLNNINLESGNDIQFKTTAGANAGKIEQDGNNLVLSNAAGDVLLGDGSSDVYIGDGTNNVDILFEQSGSIKGDGSAVTLTIGGANTTLNLENPNINGTLSLGATSINNKLTFTTANGYILFDHEPSGDTGAYEGTTSVPLLKIDRGGSEKTILERISQEGGLLLGADDSVIIAAGDTRGTLRPNLNEAAETVIFASEGGFHAYGFPSNDTTWSNRNEFRFRSDSGTASDNGLYIGDGGSTQFIDLSRNLKNISSLTVGAASPDTGVELQVTGHSKFKGDSYHSHFNYSTDQHTYIRGGKDGAEVYINDTHNSNVGIAAGGGDVGIGTNSPAQKLEVAGSAQITTNNPQLVFNDNTGSTYTSSWMYENNIMKYVWGGGKKFSISSDGGITIGQTYSSSHSAPSKGMIMEGNLGIGITDPDQALEIGAGGKLKLSRADNARSLLLYTDNNFATVESDTDPFLLKSADRIQFEANGAERMRIDSSGNVGIGTTSPSSKLTVGGNATGFSTGMQVWQSGETALSGDVGGKAATFFGTSGLSNSSIVNIYSTDAYTTQRGGEIGFGGKYRSTGGVAQFAKIRSFKTNSSDGGTNYGGGLEFWTRPNGSAAVARMTILGDGNVGIGTTSPSAPLQVFGTSAAPSVSGTFQGSIFSIKGSSTVFLDMGTTGASGYYAWMQAHDAGTGVNYKLAINPLGGNVGIGTTSPESKLHVQGSLLLQVNTFDQNSSEDSTTNPSTTTSEFMRIGHTGTYSDGRYTHEWVKLDRTGNLPLYLRQSKGTANSFENIARFGEHSYSTHRFEVFGTIAASGASIKGNTFIKDSYLKITAAAPNLIFAVPSGGLDSRIYNDGSGNFIIGHGTNSDTPTERLRIDSSGNVGIGTTSPSTKLDVDGLISSDQIQSKKYTALSGSSNDWFPIGTIDEHLTGPVLFQVITAYHSNMSFFVAKGYGPSNEHSITLLSSIYSNNSGYANIKGVRVRQDGQVEIQLYWATGPSVIVNVTARSTTLPVTLPSSLATSTSSSTVIDTVTNEDGKLRSRKLITTSSNVQLSDNGISYLNGGDVGIGTDSPSDKLVVSDGTNLNFKVGALSHQTVTGMGIGATFSRTSSDAPLMAIGVVETTKLALMSRSGLSFLVGGSNNYQYTTEAMSIDSSGNIGIGTTSPFTAGGTAKLSVSGLISWGASSSDLSYFRRLSAGNFQWQTYNGGNSGNIHLQPYGGNVGIGTTSPSSKLHLQDTNGSIIILNSNTANENNGIFMTEAAAASPYTKGAYVHYDGTNESFKINTGDSTLSTRLTILRDSGNVGIGTTSPSNALEISNTSFADQLRILRPQNTEGGIAGIINIAGINSASVVKDYARIGVIIDDNTNATEDGSLVLQTITNGTNTEKVRINSSGNVGIGTGSPSANLHIQGSSATDVPIIRVGGFGNSGSTLELAETLSNGDMTYGFSFFNDGNSSNTLQLKRHQNSAAGATIVTFNRTDNNVSFSGGLTISGNVGIGATNPSTKLYVKETGAANTAIFENSGQAYSFAAIKVAEAQNNKAVLSFAVGDALASTDIFGEINGIVTNNGGALTGDLYFKTNQGDNMQERMRILANGNVGIGTTGPTAKLYIEQQGVNWNETTQGTSVGTIHLDPAGDGATSTGNAITFGASDTSSGETAQAGIYIRSDGSYGTKMYLATTDSYASGSKTRLMINHNGNVGIGTTNPSYKLDVNGNIGGNQVFIQGLKALDSSANFLYIDPNTQFSSGIYINNRVKIDGGLLGSYNEDLQLRTGDTTRLTLSSSTGNATFAADVDVNGITTSDAFRTDTSNTDYNVISRNSTSTTLWVQAAQSNSLQGIASFRYGSATVNQGTEVFRIRRDGVNVFGTNFTVGGTITGNSKNFSIPHPTKEGKRLVHSCLEGPEIGVYFRGRSTSATIEMPDYWSGLVHLDSMTVELTAIGPNQDLYVANIADDGDVTIASNTDTALNYFYVIYGERKDLERLEVEIDDTVEVEEPEEVSFPD